MPTRTTPPPYQLRLHLEPVAKAHGIMTVPDLARTIGHPRQTLYGHWRGLTRWIHLDLYATLLAGLNPLLRLQPGDWFLWDEAGQLRWQVRQLAEDRGLKRDTFGFRVQLHPRTSDLYWHGTPTAVSFDTLARIALGLQEKDTPFQIGDLLTWTAPPQLARTGSVHAAARVAAGVGVQV